VSPQEHLLTVSEVADMLRVKPSWVYDHADELGAFRLGKYLRFSLPHLMARIEESSSAAPTLGSHSNDLD
jgi:hypothetical protein